MDGVALVDPAGQAYPDVQGPVHAAVGRAVVLPYVPAGQAVQDDAPAREYCPTGHAAAVGDMDPAGQTYPAVHSPLHMDVARPVVDPYWPALQLPVHAAVVRAAVDP
jgi:hypothetical protein